MYFYCAYRSKRIDFDVLMFEILLCTLKAHLNILVMSMGKSHVNK